MPTGLALPALNQKTSGIMTVKDNAWANAASVYVINRDHTCVIHPGAYVIAAKINNEYRPIWISFEQPPFSC